MKNDKDIYKIDGLIIPFNEAMVDGISSLPIFASDFIDKRCLSLNVTLSSYEDVVLKYIKLIDVDEKINLYFGYDMFCQINCLTILAYLEQLNIKNKVNIFICDEQKREIIDKFEVLANGFIDEFDNIVINKTKIDSKLTYLNKVIDLYFAYYNKDKQFIKNLYNGKSFENDNKLIAYLLNNYPEYGLGDIQWKKWIG